MDDYIPLHICDDLFPEDIPMGAMQNRIVLKRTVDNQEVFTLLRNPGYASNSYHR
jgi:hypothetical protein